MDTKTKNKGLDNLSVGLGVSFLVASLFNALLVVAKDSYAPLKNWMKSLSGHHWTTHGIFVIVLFIVLGYALSRTDLDETIDAAKTAWLVIAGTVLGGLIIAGFYFKHLFE